MIIPLGANQLWNILAEQTELEFFCPNIIKVIEWTEGKAGLIGSECRVEKHGGEVMTKRLTGAHETKRTLSFEVLEITP